MVVRPTPTKPVLLLRGATRACPVCGRRRLTRRVVKLRPECPRCGFVFERDSGHFVGAVGMSTIVTFGLILISMLVGIWVLWPDVDFLRLVLVPILIAIVVPPLFHPTAKTLWAAIDLCLTPLKPGEAIADITEDLPGAVDAEERPPQEG